MPAYYAGPNNSDPLIGVGIALCVVVGLMVIWRIVFRFMRGSLGLSDALLVLGLVLALCQAGFVLGASTVWGYGYHKSDLPPKIRNSPTPKLLFWLNQVFFKMETGLVKMSICVIYMEIFHTAQAGLVRISRITNYVLAAVITSYYIGGTMASLFQCSPVSKAWNSDLSGTCINNTQFRLANGYINILTSAWIIIMPFPTLLTLKRRSSEVWQLLFLVSLGLIHTSCAISRVVLMYIPQTPAAAKDPQWYNTTSNILATVEEFVGILAATIIVMRPCFHIIFKTVTGAGTTVPSTYANTRGKTRSRKSQSNILSGDRKSKSDLEGFVQIVRTTEIEMDSRDRSTDDIVKDHFHFQ